MIDTFHCLFFLSFVIQEVRALADSLSSPSIVCGSQLGQQWYCKFALLTLDRERWCRLCLIAKSTGGQGLMPQIQ